MAVGVHCLLCMHASFMWSQAYGQRRLKQGKQDVCMHFKQPRFASLQLMLKALPTGRYSLLKYSGRLTTPGNNGPQLGHPELIWAQVTETKIPGVARKQRKNSKKKLPARSFSRVHPALSKTPCSCLTLFCPLQSPEV